MVVHPVLAAHTNSHRPLLRNPPSAELLQAALAPIITIATLVVCSLMFGEALQGPHLILSLVVFSLMFPGNVPKASNMRSLIGNVLASWFITVGLLLFIGWATRTLDSFEPHVLYAWVISTPIMLTAAYFFI